VSHKRHYDLLINGEVFSAYCDTLPLGRFSVGITLRTRKNPNRRTGPNYDPNDPNSIQAALLYASVHETCLTLVWKYLYDHQGEWVRGTDLRPYGDAWRVRISELTDKYGWPIERRSPNGPGVWWYRMPVLASPQPRTKRIIPRQP
jgi:hypothetical protein